MYSTYRNLSHSGMLIILRNVVGFRPIEFVRARLCEMHDQWTSTVPPRLAELEQLDTESNSECS